MFCGALLYVQSSFAIILIGKRELVALLSLSSWCLMIVVWLFFTVPWVCLQFVIVVFPDHTHYFSKLKACPTIVQLKETIAINCDWVYNRACILSHNIRAVSHSF